MSRVEIYKLHKKDGKWQKPKKIFYKGRDKSKWCDFHRDYDHVTDNYKTTSKTWYEEDTSSSTKQEQIESPHLEGMKMTTESR